MAVIIELFLPLKNSPLGTMLTADTDLHIEFERIMPVGADVAPIFWAWDDDLDAFEQRVRDDSNVQQFLAIDEVGDRRLYLLTWDIPAGAFLTTIYHLLHSLLIYCQIIIAQVRNLIRMLHVSPLATFCNDGFSGGRNLCRGVVVVGVNRSQYLPLSVR